MNEIVNKFLLAGDKMQMPEMQSPLHLQINLKLIFQIMQQKQILKIFPMFIHQVLH